MRDDYSLDDTLMKVSISEKRWLRAKHVMIVALLALAAIGEIALIRSMLPAAASTSSGPALGVVNLVGVMAADSEAGAEKVIPALQEAFEDDSVKEVALFIDSPGGAPAEAERIGDFLQAERKKTGKPTIAIISNLGASAAYLTAIKADSIMAGRYSLVGSIGAVVQGWGLDKVMKKFDVEQRVFASGEFKTMLNPFQPLSGPAAAKAQAMADTAGEMFAKDVAAARGKKLKLVRYATGEVWTGEAAQANGLVDSIGTIDSYAAGKKLALKQFGPFHSKALPFVKTFAQGVADALKGEASMRLN
jgi:protease-4